MKIITNNKNFQVKLNKRSRVVVVSNPERYKHAIKQLKYYLSISNLEVIEIIDFKKFTSNSKMKHIDLLILLADLKNIKYLETIVRIEFYKDVSDIVEDAFLIQTSDFKGLDTLIIIGGNVPGVIYAVNELGMHHLNIHNNIINLSSINIFQSPALPYRLFWTWDHSTNWYLEQVGIQEIGAMNYYSKPKEGFLEDYYRLINFMSKNRINGVTIYGFLRDSHGGIEAAKELCLYAKERGVKILPGVGINAYGGIYFEGNHRYNLTNWLKEHPELRAVFDNHLHFITQIYQNYGFLKVNIMMPLAHQSLKIDVIMKKQLVGLLKLLI